MCVVDGISRDGRLAWPLDLRRGDGDFRRSLLDRLGHRHRSGNSAVFSLRLRLDAGVRAIAWLDFIQPIHTWACALNNGGGFSGAEVLGLGAGVGRCGCGDGDDFFCFGGEGGGHEGGGLGGGGAVEEGGSRGDNINASAVGVFGREGGDGAEGGEGGEEEGGAHDGGGGG